MKLALLSLLLLLAFCAATLAATNGNPGNNGSAATTTPASAQRPPSQVNPAGFNNNENNNNNSASSAMAAPQQQQSVQFQSGGDNCPPLLGNNFPSRQTLTAQGGQSSQSCQWIIISNQQNCPQFFQNCGSNQQMCRSQNEIWWQCTSDCEPSCGNPSPSCRRRCGRSGCQCFPGFLRNQGGFCVPSSQCPSADCSDDNDCPGQSVCVNSQCQQPDCSNDNDCPGNQICENNQCQESGCSNDNDCPGSSSICVNRQCRQGCTSDNACAIDAQCSNGRCVERRQCQQDRQCRGQKICFNRQCRLVGSISCRSNFDCPRSAFCGRNGRCFFPNTRAIEDGFDF